MYSEWHPPHYIKDVPIKCTTLAQPYVMVRRLLNGFVQAIFGF